MAEKQFAKGFIFKRPREGAPDFVKGSMSIKVEEAITFLRETAKGEWVNLDLLASKDGSKLYFTVNDWKPKNPDLHEGNAPELP